LTPEALFGSGEPLLTVCPRAIHAGYRFYSLGDGMLIL
jgi:S-adenosylmethionine:tRNA-ribosyltransferase-isomerase (queuine synthetase)